SAACHMTFFGTQPTLTQVPPRRCGSIRATRAPYCAARRAVAMPPLPPPITSRSWFVMPGLLADSGSSFQLSLRVFLSWCQYFAGIHDAVRIHGPFQRPHEFDFLRCAAIFQPGALVQADAVFRRYGTGQVRYDVVAGLFDGVFRVAVRRYRADHAVYVAVADVAEVHVDEIREAAVHDCAHALDAGVDGGYGHGHVEIDGRCQLLEQIPDAVTQGPEAVRLGL